ALRRTRSARRPDRASGSRSRRRALRGAASGSSPAFEDRLAFAHEGVHALLLVLRREEEIEGLALELEAGVERCVPRKVDSFGRESYRHGRLLRDRARERFRVVEPRCRRIDLRDETDRFRLVRLDASPGEDQLVGDELADRPREAVRATSTGDDPEIDLRLAEL